MHFVPGYSMMAATATTFMLSMIFLLLSGPVSYTHLTLPTIA